MKNGNRYSLMLLALFLILASCNKSEMGYDSYTLEMESPSSQVEEITGSDDRKLIKDARLEFETESLEKSRETIFEAAKKHGGYVASDRESTSTNRISNTMTVRVPDTSFDAFMNEVSRGVKKFDSKEIDVMDVTEEFMDVEARLKTKKELELRYLELLKQAKTVTEVLEIEKELAQVRADIESAEGRIKYMQDRVSFSTLTLYFYETISYKTEFGKKFSNGFKQGRNNLIWFFVALVNIWPFILIIITAIILVRYYKRRKRNEKI